MEKSKALLIIDMLNDFVREGAPLKIENIEKIIDPIKKEIEKAKQSFCPVIYLCDRHDENDREFRLFPKHAVKNSKGESIIDEIRPEGNDIIVRKSTFSGFYNTNLENVLKKLEIKKLVLVGCATNICVLYTAADAVMRGYDVDVVKKATIGTEKREHNSSLRHMQKILKINIL